MMPVMRSLESNSWNSIFSTRMPRKMRFFSPRSARTLSDLLLLPAIGGGEHQVP